MTRKIELVRKQIELKNPDQASSDLEFWLNKTPQERLQAVTFLIRQNMAFNQKMDKTVFSQRSMK